MDRLDNSFWTENEITEFNKQDITPDKPKWSAEPTQKSMATYTLHKDGKFTGTMLILAVDSQIDTYEALNTEWADTGLVIQLGECGDPTYGWEKKIEALQIVLERYKYTPKFNDVLGCDCIYRYEQWVENLL